MRETINKWNDPTRKGGSLQTFTGLVFWPMDPRLEEIDYRDIAHGLASEGRFQGQTRNFYSVGEHSVRVSRLLKKQGYNAIIQFLGLHHDDSEAYLGDLPSPLKKLDEFAFFREAENYLQDLCFQKFGILQFHTEENKKVIKAADIIMLLTEKRELMKKSEWERNTKDLQPLPPSYKISGWSPKVAEKKYLELHLTLQKEVKKLLKNGNLTNQR